MINLFFVILTSLTLVISYADARRYGVHPFQRLTSDGELNQP